MKVSAVGTALPCGSTLRRRARASTLLLLAGAMLVFVPSALSAGPGPAPPNRPGASKPAGPNVLANGAVISNGTVALGVNAAGDLNYTCAPEEPNCPANAEGVGVRFVSTGNDATYPGCLCEGWGAADEGSGLTGSANEDFGAPVNITVDDFTTTLSTAVSTVTISDAGLPNYSMQVVQNYHPYAGSSYLYEDTVTITNTGTQPFSNLRYRRVMDWDVEPTAFSEWVTIHKIGQSPYLDFDSDDGFADSDPLAGPSYLDSEAVCGPAYTGTCTFTDLGYAGVYPTTDMPDDHGSLFDFAFGNLPVGTSRSFKILYGAAPSEAAANAVVNQTGADVYSLGEDDCPESGFGIPGCGDLSAHAGVEQGLPNTFIFAFKTAATITLAPVLVQAGAATTVTGNGFQPTEGVTFTLWACQPSCSSLGVIGSTTADNAGALNAPATIPAATRSGLYFVVASGNTSGVFAYQPTFVLGSVTPTPGAATPGSVVGLSGSGFGNSETVNLSLFQCTPGCTLAGSLGSTATDGNGNFNQNVQIPAGKRSGTYYIVAQGATSGGLAYTQFFVMATLAVAPSSGAAGSHPLASGTGFANSETVYFLLFDCSVSCTYAGTAGSTTSNGTGAFSGVSLTIPAVAPGTYVMLDYGATSGGLGAALFTVTGPGPFGYRPAGTFAPQAMIPGIAKQLLPPQRAAERLLLKRLVAPRLARAKRTQLPAS